jgi:hypothetical protein
MKRLFTILLISTALHNAAAQSTAAGNFIVSVGASKNSYFSTLFQRAATFEFPVNLEVMLSSDFSLGIKGAPVFINNVSNNYLENSNSAKKNDNTGYLLFGLGNINYYAYNEDRLLWKISGEAGYGKMDKIKFEEDIRSEVKAAGMIYRLGTSLRYHLGNEYEDIYPTFFELGLGISQLAMKVSESTLAGLTLPSAHSTWSPLNFGTFDVALTFGYRFGKPK